MSDRPDTLLKLGSVAKRSVIRKVKVVKHIDNLSHGPLANCIRVAVDGFYSYLTPVGSLSLRMLHFGRLSFDGAQGGFEDLPRGTYATITTFDRWTDFATVIVDDFCGYLAPVTGSGLRMLHFGRLSFGQ
ncbi:hypothetical protein JCGZ_03891 [Jatropha curcas]|uniref:Uncharacterized protein n=1 Tax=Jatropha curcas TaxID=180498 RepID=A0A067LI56_JATCU|nr:hypothetical protein JCGZ_03891 [Jatropha curcas]